MATAKTSIATHARSAPIPIPALARTRVARDAASRSVESTTQTPFAAYLTWLKTERLPATVSILTRGRTSVLRASVREGEIVELVWLEATNLRHSLCLGIVRSVLVDHAGYWKDPDEDTLVLREGGAPPSPRHGCEHHDGGLLLADLADHYHDGDVLDPETLRAIRAIQARVQGHERHVREACLDFVALRMRALYDETLAALGLDDERCKAWLASESDREMNLADEQISRALAVRLFLEGHEPGRLLPREQATWQVSARERCSPGSGTAVVDRLLLAFRAVQVRYE